MGIGDDAVDNCRTMAMSRLEGMEPSRQVKGLTFGRSLRESSRVTGGMADQAAPVQGGIEMVVGVCEIHLCLLLFSQGNEK